MDKNKKQMEQLVDMFVKAVQHLGGSAVLVGIVVGDGCFAARMGEMFTVAQLIREVNNSILNDVPREHLQEFAKAMGSRIVSTKEEYDKLTGNEPEFEDFEVPPGSYHSKTVH